MACITDTDSIDLNITNGQLSADVKVSGGAGNLLTIEGDGLLVDGLNAFPPGMIAPYGGDVAPTGWLLCDGAEVSRSTQATLFGIIGTKFGIGDGSTTFNLPDTRGRVLPGVAPTGGHADMDTIGEDDGSLLVNRRTKHRHTPHAHKGNVDGNGGAGAIVVAQKTTNATETLETNPGQAVDGGSGVATDPLDGPAYLVVGYIIKV